jgi:uroporphyrinogen-III decarboxylase
MGSSAIRFPDMVTAMSDDGNKALYLERVQRIADAVALRETDRVPLIYTSRFWSATLAGMTFEEVMYSVDKNIAATRKAVELLQPDAYSAVLYSYGQAMETMDYKPMQWPGHGADPNVCFQYLDEEFMHADEYEEFLFDPTGYYLHKYLPRVVGSYEALSYLPDFPVQSEWGVISGISAFANPKLQEGFKRLFKAGEQAAEVIQKTVAFIGEMKAEGFPIATGGFCKSPFDHLVDAMRGSKSGMLDLFRNKDKLLAAVDKLGQFLLRGVKAGAEQAGCPYVFIPLHWGLDGFMSPDQFKTMYWPDLRKIIVHLIDDDLVPVVLWEGNCTSRLEYIGDIPAGKAIYWFESTDLVKAKEILGDVVCLRGNIPASLLITGTPDDVDVYCKNLIEKVGKNGGFILDGAASVPDEAKVENVVAMFKSVTKYAK